MVFREEEANLGFRAADRQYPGNKKSGLKKAAFVILYCLHCPVLC